MILRGIFHVVSCFPLHFMLYRGNLDCVSISVGLSNHILSFSSWFYDMQMPLESEKIHKNSFKCVQLVVIPFFQFLLHRVQKNSKPLQNLRISSKNVFFKLNFIKRKFVRFLKFSWFSWTCSSNFLKECFFKVKFYQKKLCKAFRIFLI